MTKKVKFHYDQSKVLHGKNALDNIKTRQFFCEILHIMRRLQIIHR